MDMAINLDSLGDVGPANSDRFGPIAALTLVAVMERLEQRLTRTASRLDRLEEILPTPELALRPSRLNFAGYCEWCGERSCHKQKCVDRHARSVWELCDLCGGSERLDDRICGCAGGLQEANVHSPVRSE